ncbi:MAG: sulfite exporter TauE/SafE family protein [Gammaproteobacteria bacterium]
MIAETFLAGSVLGIISGLSAGLFGIGGGLFIVPFLAMLFSAHSFHPDLVMIMSVATSLATIMFTSLSSVLAHHRLGSMVWEKVINLSPGIMAGAVIGALVAHFISGGLLRTLFIIYLLYVALQLALQTRPKPGRLTATKNQDRIAAVMIGLLSAILGIGGGTMIVPYLVYFQSSMRNAVAVASACGFPIALAGTISYGVLGWEATHLPAWSFGYIYLPSFFGIVLTSIFTAPYGAKLANTIPAQKLKRYFSILLLVIALKMIW